MNYELRIRSDELGIMSYELGIILCAIRKKLIGILNLTMKKIQSKIG
jgi:hypothetical protein